MTASEWSAWFHAYVEDVGFERWDAKYECTERVSNLLRNLAAGAALCRAFDLGWSACDALIASVDLRQTAYWEPGCRRAAP